MSTPTKSAPGRCANTAEGQNFATNHHEGAKSVNNIARECRHCTVPTENGAEVCQFCRYYDGGPVDSSTRACCGGLGGHAPGCVSHNVPGLLADASLGARTTVADLSDAINSVPGEAPLLAVVDLVGARAHMMAAQRLIDRAAARLGDGSVDR